MSRGESKRGGSSSGARRWRRRCSTPTKWAEGRSATASCDGVGSERVRVRGSQCGEMAASVRGLLSWEEGTALQQQRSMQACQCAAVYSHGTKGCALAWGMMGTPSASTASASRDFEIVAAEGGLPDRAAGPAAPAAEAAAASSAASAASSASDCRPSTVTLLMQNAGRRPEGQTGQVRVGADSQL